MKTAQKGKQKRRTPRQERSQDKVELILEGAAQLIDEKGIETLSTNAIASPAGVSIGTLYQYFDDKEAVIDVLTERELGNLVIQVLEALRGPAPNKPGGKVVT